MATPSTERTILIIDEDPASARAIRRFASERGHAVLAFGDRAEFLAWKDSQRPGYCQLANACCLIFDAQFVDLLQREPVFHLIGDCPRICISRSAKPSVTFNSVKLGLFEFIEKPFRIAQLAETVDRAFAYCDDLACQTAQFETFRERLHTLTHRELEVCKLLAAGLSSKAISFRLGIAIKTFYVHRANLTGKLGAKALSEIGVYRKMLGVEQTSN
jgi:two-component system, LuxR family, response regulator FixJ